MAMDYRPDVAIVGLGYVGLTLALTMAQAGIRVWGYEREPRVVKQLNEGSPHIFEPGLEAALQRQLGENLIVMDHLPKVLPDAVIICVSTPVGSDNTPVLGNLQAAVNYVAERSAQETLVIIRSTVPVGTTRKVVLPILLAKHREALVACCPERTIQGKAMEELCRLPQVVGALNETSQQRSVHLWESVVDRVVTVSSLEAAEMVKLINNCHTDLIYAFGNEVAMMANQFSLDPAELIHAANFNYPRPSLARPGFVSGPCLTKDPYLLLSSLDSGSYKPLLVPNARNINESLPHVVANHFLTCLKQLDGGLDNVKVLVCGFAYKGWPATDDVRGSPTSVILEVLQRYPLRIYGHDFMVSPETISEMGAFPIRDLAQGFDGAKAVLFVNEHPNYRQLNLTDIAERLEQPALLYDSWRMFDKNDMGSMPNVKYVGIGYG